MERMGALIALISVAAVAACHAPSDEVCREPAYAIQVDLAVPADVGRQGVVVHWADQAPADGVAGPAGYGVVRLRRAFATRAEAVRFDVPFVVRVGGVERARAPVAFAECDEVAALGHDPAERRQAVITRTLDGDGTIRAAVGPTCVVTAGPMLEEALAAGCPSSERWLLYRLRLAAPAGSTQVLVDGVAVAPYAIAPRGPVLEIALPSPIDAPVTGVRHDLAIEQDGVRTTTFEARFQPCISAAIDHDLDPESLVLQRQALEIADGVLRVDEWSGYACLTASGLPISVIP